MCRSPWRPERVGLRPNARHRFGTGVRTQEHGAGERAWRSSPEGLLPGPPQAREVQTVQNDPPANSCILRHHRTLALLPGKVQSNGDFRGARVAACSSPHSRFEPAVRTPGGPVCRPPPAAQGSEASPAARNTPDSSRIPRASKLLVCGLFQKGRVLAQDGIETRPTERTSILASTVSG